MKTIQLVGVQSCQIFICSKGAPQKMQIFGAIKPAGKSRPVAPNKTQNGGKTSHRIDRHRPKRPNISESKLSCSHSNSP